MWKGCTVEQWTDKKKGVTSRRPLPIKKDAVAMKPIGEANTPTGRAKAPRANANNVLATDE